MLRLLGRAIQVKPDLARRHRVLLLATSSPAPKRKRPRWARLRVVRLPISTVRSGMTAAAVTGPQLAIERAAQRVGGGGPTGEGRRQAVAMAGNAALVATGVLAQRAVLHVRATGPTGLVTRAFAREVAVGGLAGALIVGTDALVGDFTRGHRYRAAIALSLGGLLASAQSRALRHGQRLVTLPTPPPATWDLPVLGVPGYATLRVPVPRGGAAGLRPIPR